ncbi:MAG TPA: D-alanyl-D-alanine carboxypeptidase [Streptosporangiaceae bacterium]|nr:D-alanyl-D-alanine carboxypeptidase [Streptosporangiaceae bacterium]
MAAGAALLTLAAAVAPAVSAQAASGQAAAVRPVVGGPQLAGRGVIVNYPARGARKLPRIPASAYLVADATTGQVLAAKDPHGHFLPASTLKILTADTLMPVLNPARTVVTSHMAAVVTPSRVGLIQGHRYRVADLFRALLLISANDAAISLAQAAGSYHHGVAMMNAEARHLQADDTVAVRPNGLNARGQHTSAYDLALFARQALRMPEFLRIERLHVAKFPLYRRAKVNLWNQNSLLGSYPGDIAGKIGWTSQARATYIGWARRGGHTLIVTLMHCTPLTEMVFAAKLLNWGFAMDGKVRPVGQLAAPLPARTAGHPVPPRPATAPRVARQVRASGFPAIPVAAGAAALLVVAALVAGIVTVVVRRPPRGGSPPGP